MPSSRWVLNGHSTAALGTSVGDDFGSLDTQGGLGAGVEVGYRVTPRLLAYAGLDIAKQGDRRGGARRRLRPHSHRGRREAQLPDHGQQADALRRRLGGPAQPHYDHGRLRDGSQLGPLAVGARGGRIGGVQFFVSPSLALDGGVSLGIGKMGNVKVDGHKEDWGTPDNTTTTRLRFGANWYP